MVHMCRSGQPLPLCRSWEWNLSCQAYEETPLSTEPFEFALIIYRFLVFFPQVGPGDGSVGKMPEELSSDP